MSSVLITGANRGIGLELARQYLAEGWQTIGACRTPDSAVELHSLSQQHPGQLEIAECDVDSDESVQRLAERLAGTTLDLLINNAGVVDAEAYGSGAYEGTDDPDPKNYDFDQWLSVLQTNVLSPARVTAAFVGQLERSSNGVVVMMGSTLGSVELTNDPGRYSYRTSKAALNSLMRSMGSWLITKGIVTVTISPGWTRTAMGGPNAMNSVEQSVSGVREVIAGLSSEDVGRFLNFDGSELPW